ncbi:hypothetical protein R4I97_08310 [Brachyspira pilosicoli]|uniref:hypothetical protein n=1 Tax=Brachyspira pilosicoli TaxID=52584 RepID=UPI003003B7F5
MNKKILSIIFSLFLVGVFSISCSNAEQQTDPKGIEQYNGNSYVSENSFNYQSSQVYLWLTVKDGKVGIINGNDQTSEPTYLGYMDVTGSGTDYTFDSGDNTVSGTLKFTDTSVTVNFTKNAAMPSIEGQNIVCNKK